MRKLVFAIAVILIGIVGWNMLQVQDHNLRLVLKKNWGVELTEPESAEVVIESEFSFKGKGEDYRILNYEEKQMDRMRKKDYWTVVDESTIQEVEQMIAQFMEDALSLHESDVGREDYLAKFERYPVPVKIGDSYYIDDREGNGTNYLILVLDEPTNRVYWLEWHE